MSASAAQNMRERLQQDLPIERQRPLIDVLHVQLHPSLKNQRHRRPLTAHRLVMPGLIRNLLRCHRSYCSTSSGRAGRGPTSALVALQHVPQLGRFIDRKFLQRAPHAGQPRIAGESSSLASWRSLRCSTSARIASAARPHRLTKSHRILNVASVRPAADLPENRRAGRGEADQQRDQQHEGKTEKSPPRRRSPNRSGASTRRRISPPGVAE